MGLGVMSGLKVWLRLSLNRGPGLGWRLHLDRGPRLGWRQRLG